MQDAAVGLERNLRSLARFMLGKVTGV